MSVSTDPGGGSTPLSGSNGNVNNPDVQASSKPLFSSILQNSTCPQSMTAATAVGGFSGGRSWKQILEDAAKEVFIELKIRKISKIVENETVKPRNLKHDDIATFIYDVLKVNHNDIIALDFTSGRYDSREIQLKPHVDPTKFTNVEPYVFMEHQISVTAKNNKSTKITFRNVPLTVPDEEILHLAYHYGRPINNNVTREILNNEKSKGKRGSTRFLEMDLEKGKSFNNYYWMAGPLPGDHGRRIVVTHPGQTPQCSHCLKKAGQGCPAAGNGFNCEKVGTPRAQMKEYMLDLRAKTGYVSLKVSHSEAESSFHASLYEEHNKLVEVNMEEEIIDENDESTPAEHKERVIQDQEKKLSHFESILAKNVDLQKTQKESLSQMESNVKLLKQKSSTLTHHLTRSKAVVEVRLLERLEDKDWDLEVSKDDIGFEVTTLATLLSDEDVDSDTEKTSEERCKNSAFLQGLKDKIDPIDPKAAEKFNSLAKILLQRYDDLKTQRGRRLSIRKRTRSDQQEERSSSRQRLL